MAVAFAGLVTEDRDIVRLQLDGFSVNEKNLRVTHDDCSYLFLLRVVSLAAAIAFLIHSFGPSESWDVVFLPRLVLDMVQCFLIFFFFFVINKSS